MINADRVFADLKSLFCEVEIDDCGCFRLPAEMRPANVSVPAKEADELIMKSIEMVCGQLFLLAEQMLAIPDCDERLAKFFKEWEGQHSANGQTVFYYLRFRLEARLNWLRAQR